jgi:hypothetical protein
LAPTSSSSEVGYHRLILYPINLHLTRVQTYTCINPPYFLYCLPSLSMEHIDAPALQSPRDATTSRRPSQESAKSMAVSSRSFRSAISLLSSLFSRKSETSTIHTSRPVSEVPYGYSGIPLPSNSLRNIPSQPLKKQNIQTDDVPSEEETQVQKYDGVIQDIVAATRNLAEDSLFATSPIIPDPIHSRPPPNRTKCHKCSSSTAATHRRIPLSQTTTRARLTSESGSDSQGPQSPLPHMKQEKPFSQRLGAFFCRSANPDTDWDCEPNRSARVSQLKPHLNYHYRLKRSASRQVNQGISSYGLPQHTSHMSSPTHLQHSAPTCKPLKPDGIAESRYNLGSR